MHQEPILPNIPAKELTMLELFISKLKKGFAFLLIFAGD